MQSIKKTFVNLTLFAFAATVILTASTEARAQAKLQKAIAAHINKIREDAVEYRGARKIVYGDLDGDGKQDAVVQYTLEGAGGGNSWGQNLAVFLNKKGVYVLAADETVGGKFFCRFTVQKVVGREITAATETCPADYPQDVCENPAKKRVKFVLTGGKLTEK